jgi:alkaline phosphatase
MPHTGSSFRPVLLSATVYVCPKDKRFTTGTVLTTQSLHATPATVSKTRRRFKHELQKNTTCNRRSIRTVRSTTGPWWATADIQTSTLKSHDHQ